MEPIIVTKTEWDFSAMYSGDNDPKMAEDRKKIQAATDAFEAKWKFNTAYLQDPAVLKEALDEADEYKSHYYQGGPELFYFHLRCQQDENDPELKAKYSKIEEFANNIGNQLQFFELNISKIPAERQSVFLDFEALAPYKHYLERLFAASKFLLSEPEEKIMSLKSTASYGRWVDMTSSFISKEERDVTNEAGQTEPKNFSELAHLIDSIHKPVRDSAARAFNDILEKHSDVAEAEINAILEDKKVNDMLRGIPRPDAARHISDDISSEAVDGLVTAVSSRFDIAKRYYQLKAKLLKVPKLQYHERNIPYGTFDATYSYDDSVKLVYNVLSNIDPEFGSIFKMFNDTGAIDVYPKKGKRSGAFCAYNLHDKPVYIFLNHTNKLRDVETLAHEAGHGINDELIRKSQNATNFETPLATAEVASTFMEDFIGKEIAKNLSPEQKLALEIDRIGQDISTIFRQVACYNFETELHAEYRKQGYLSKETIGTMFQKHMGAYMGEAVEMSAGSQNWWIYWSHIRSYFYVYSYASGLLISKAMQNKFKADPSFIQNIKTFLSAGISKSPKDLFLDMGINIEDVAFWNQGIDEIEKSLEEATKLAKEMGATD